MRTKRAGRTQIPSRQAAFAKAMRRDMTEAERKLWKALRWRLALEGRHFRRQVCIGPYIADFCSYGRKVIIEVNGNQDGNDAFVARDKARTTYLQSQGYRVLRFSNRD